MGVIGIGVLDADGDHIATFAVKENGYYQSATDEMALSQATNEQASDGCWLNSTDDCYHNRIMVTKIHIR